MKTLLAAILAVLSTASLAQTEGRVAFYANITAMYSMPKSWMMPSLRVQSG